MSTYIRTARRSAVCLASTLLVAGCSRPDEPVSAAPAAVVYGTDDRVEVYEAPSAALGDWARQSAVTLVYADDIRFGSDGNVQVVGSSLADAYDLCADQRFAEQPTYGDCSASLIDDDLVLTAGHCVQDLEECRSFRYVFDYLYESEGVLAAIEPQDVYSCRTLLAQEMTDNIDYAIVQLDRPVDSSRRPSAVQTSLTAISDSASLTLIGNPSGLPIKIAAGASVLNPRVTALDYFTASLDAFGGNSGSAVLDDELRVVGILVQGDEDYRSRGSCTVVNVVPETGGPFGGEHSTYVGRALNDLCGTGWPSERLCARAPSCGDARCSGVETPETCTMDCIAPTCGDGICNFGEDGSCDDCPTLRVPDGWTCDGRYYDDGYRCNCECGVPDPDCSTNAYDYSGCDDGESCNAMGACIPVPSAWRCEDPTYGNGGDCNCGCGAYDPDCDTSTRVRGCGRGGVCSAQGTCVVADAGMSSRDASAVGDADVAGPDASMMSVADAASDRVDAAPDAPRIGFRSIGCAVGERGSSDGMAPWLLNVLALGVALRRRRQ